MDSQHELYKGRLLNIESTGHRTIWVDLGHLLFGNFTTII